jgi:hypothetical protein
MRRRLVAGVVAVAFVAALPLSAFADSTSPSVPITTRSGKLDGAVNNSVTVSIGGTMFTGMALSRGSRGANQPMTGGANQH